MDRQGSQQLTRHESLPWQQYSRLQALKGSVVDPTSQQGGAEGPCQRPVPPVHRSGRHSLLAPRPLRWLPVAGFLCGKCTQGFIYVQVKAADKRQ